MRTPEQITDDYTKFRGKCKEMCDDLLVEDPTLTLVRGHYFCLAWGTDEPHWWLKKQDGTIVDPSCRQFPCNGSGIYTEFNGMVECAECGKEMKEEDSRFESRYVFCDVKCNMRFVGL